MFNLESKKESLKKLLIDECENACEIIDEIEDITELEVTLKSDNITIKIILEVND